MKNTSSNWKAERKSCLLQVISAGGKFLRKNWTSKKKRIF